MNGSNCGFVMGIESRLQLRHGRLQDVEIRSTIKPEER
jgi:hypothetical protein